ncbi:hypothetical protein X737_36950 [Mesorhizobium sp. L48C026A00]|nr:hypothetical protein X737_36950 [Mesorhizobium sp. L48C026A00]
MSLPKLVIFDCDGVLVDTENLANRRLAEWLSAAGYPASFEYCRKNFSGRAMVSVQKEVEATGASLGADFVDRWNAGLPDLFAHGVEAVPMSGSSSKPCTLPASQLASLRRRG